MIARRLARGDIVLATIPFTDLQSAKVRPALVVSDGLIGHDVVLAAISSVVRSTGDKFDVVLDGQHPDFAQSGLLRTSVVRTHHLVTVQERVAARYLGYLAADWLAEVNQKLRSALGLEAS
jgi:mRNA interferase MazF